MKQLYTTPLCLYDKIIESIDTIKSRHRRAMIILKEKIKTLR